MKRFIAMWVLLLSFSGVALAADKKKEEKAPAAPAVKAEKVEAPVAAPAPAESEAARDWKGIQAQEQWVTRLKKQLEGESKQLSEMHGTLAEKFKLDKKKVEAGGYVYDEKKDKFVER